MNKLCVALLAFFLVEFAYMPTNVLWAQPTPVSPQPVPGEAGQSLFSLESTITRVVILVAATLLATAFFFMVLFPWLLNRRMWPLPAYGISLTFTLAVVVGVVVWLFRNDMVFGEPPYSFTEQHAGWMIAVVVWIVLSAMIISTCTRRSRRRRA